MLPSRQVSYLGRATALLLFSLLSSAVVKKKERVRAALRGKAVDRVPTSFWGHDYLREWSPSGLAAAMVEPSAVTAGTI